MKKTATHEHACFFWKLSFILIEFFQKLLISLKILIPFIISPLLIFVSEERHWLKLFRKCNSNRSCLSRFVQTSPFEPMYWRILQQMWGKHKRASNQLKPIIRKWLAVTFYLEMRVISFWYENITRPYSL